MFSRGLRWAQVVWAVLVTNWKIHGLNCLSPLGSLCWSVLKHLHRSPMRIKCQRGTKGMVSCIKELFCIYRSLLQWPLEKEAAESKKEKKIAGVFFSSGLNYYKEVKKLFLGVFTSLEIWSLAALTSCFMHKLNTFPLWVQNKGMEAECGCL